MTDTWYRGEGVGVPRATGGSTAPHDLGDGMYLSDSQSAAKKYAELRAPEASKQRVYSVAIDSKGLRILDLTKDPRWDKFMKPAAPGLPSQVDLIKQANENYGRAFQNFARAEKIDLSKYDAVVGHDYVRGGKQMSILLKDSKPSRLEMQVRGRFRLLLPSGSGIRMVGTLKLVGGTFAMLGLSLLLMYLRQRFVQSLIEKAMKKLEPKIQVELLKKIGEATALFVSGQKVFANITVTLTEAYVFGGPTIGMTDTAPALEFTSLIISNRPINTEGPVKSSYGIGSIVHQKPITYSVEISL